MNVTLRQLQVFAKVAETGSFTRASEQLFLTQPAVSQQIRLLTEAIGEPVLEVMGRKIHLTPAGQALLRTAQAMAQQWQQFEDDIVAARGLQGGSLKLAVVSSAQGLFARLLGVFCQRYPEIELRLEVMNQERVIERIGANLDDLYLLDVMGKLPENLDLLTQPFLANPLLPIAAPDHPLAQLRQPEGARLSLRQLCEQRFIVREQGSGTRGMIERYVQTQGERLQRRMELGSNQAILQAVAGGLGVAIVSRHGLPLQAAADEAVVILPVTGFPLQAQWQFAYLRQKKLSHAAQAFLQLVQQWLAREKVAEAPQEVAAAQAPECAPARSHQQSVKIR